MKGQTAVEYLMTYGWAILIILIVAGVLAYYGIFAPSGFLGVSSRGFTQVAVLSPWSLDVTGNLRMQIENRVGQDIYLANVSAATGSGVNTTLCVNTTTTFTPLVIAAGQKSNVFTVNCNAGVGTGNSGATYTISAAIQYGLAGTTNLFNSTGTLSGTRS